MLSLHDPIHLAHSLMNSGDPLRSLAVSLPPRDLAKVKLVGLLGQRLGLARNQKSQKARHVIICRPVEFLPCKWFL